MSDGSVINRLIHKIEELYSRYSYSLPGIHLLAVPRFLLSRFLYKAYAVVTDTNPKWIEIRYGETVLDQFETPADIGLDGSQVLTAAYIEDEGKPTHDASKDVRL